MKLRMSLVDGWFGEFYPTVKEHILNLDYRDEVDPKEHITYEGIGRVDQMVIDYCQGRLQELFCKSVKINLGFMRRNEETRKIPGAVHTDSVQGQYNLIIYFNNVGGTSVLAHAETGMHYEPANDEDKAIFYRDKYEYGAWTPLTFAPAIEDLACIIDSGLLHRAEPPTGFGVGKDARHVLVVFFDVLDTQ